jgi:CDP-diacylglycerol---glycerol-3-phosphate 3-phosphatidyltransferase
MTESNELNIWTIPNAITGFRLILAPCVVATICMSVTDEGLEVPWLLCSLIGLLVGEISDIADGSIARRTGTVSNLGKLLDPMSDSLFRMFVFLAFLSVGWIPLWMVCILFARDILVAYLRVFSALGNIVLSARQSGKIKAISQAVCQNGILLFTLLDTIGVLPEILQTDVPIENICWTLCLIATVVTGWSGIDYAMHVWKKSIAPRA